MSEYKEIPQTYRCRKMIGFWMNLMQNLDEECRDNDMFDPAAINISRDRVVRFIRAAFTDEELERMTAESRSRRERLCLDDCTEDILQSVWNADGMRRKCKAVLKAIGKSILAGLKTSEEKEGLEVRLEELQRVLKLNDIEREILTFAYLKSETCLEYPRRIDTSERPKYFAMALNRAYGEVLGAMSPNGRLRKFNLLDNDWDFCHRGYGPYLCGTEAAALERRFYRKCETVESLPWEYYGTLAEKHGKLLKKMLAANKIAARNGNGRLNILLYGAPGTGKTSFARTLAREMGLQAYEVMQGDDNGRNQNAEARMVGIQLCNEQVDAAESLMIVDEADELLRGNGGFFSIFGFDMGGKSTEKGVMNGILDGMKVPAIWICNASAGRIDESVRRRFDYSICYEALNMSQREAIWRNAVAKYELDDLIDGKSIPGLAAKYLVSAGGISIVLENIRKLNPGKEDVETTIDLLMQQHCQLMETGKKGKFLLAKDYSLEGLNIKGKVKLDKIISCVENYAKDFVSSESPDRPRMNILLWGPPGSGKTEFVKYLGEKTGRRVIVKKGSDILGMYVGQSEQNIRDAFREAEADHAILFFDEIDGLLQSREGASQSWQVSQVNELLQQMEEFDGIMVAATNFFRNLDPAVMRRFTFKLEFDFLDEVGKKHFFEHMFKASLTDAEVVELEGIANLCPGDFRTVRQSLYYLGGAATNADRLEALRAESEVKTKDGLEHHMGF